MMAELESLRSEASMVNAQRKELKEKATNLSVAINVTESQLTAALPENPIPPTRIGA
jgi:hypothetical protein